MGILFVLLVLIGVTLYFMFFWSPNEAPTTAPSTPTVAGGQTAAFSQPQSQACLDFEKVWYGMTFRGYRDDYRLSTTRIFGETMQAVRVFFTSRKAKLQSAEGDRLLFSRGKKIYKYLGGPDTWPTQEIEVSFQAENGRTTIAIQYRVAGWHVRFPPNQLRREVLELHTELVGAESSGAANRSQPVQPDTTRSPAAAGSGR